MVNPWRVGSDPASPQVQREAATRGFGDEPRLSGVVLRGDRRDDGREDDAVPRGLERRRLPRVGGRAVERRRHRVGWRLRATDVREDEATRSRTPAETRRSRPSQSATATQGSATRSSTDGIEKISDTKYNIQRSLVDKVLANQGSLMKSARVIPHEENGRVVGVKLYGIRRTSLLGRLGVRNGDMLRTINGFDMTSPDTALEAYSRLRTADKLTLAVKRQNKETTIEYNIE